MNLNTLSLLAPAATVAHPTSLEFQYMNPQYRHLMLRLLLLVLTGLLSAPSLATAGGGGKVAILDIQTTSIDPKYVTILTEVLSTDVEELGHYDTVIAGRDIATMMGFERQRELIGCNDTECLVELGGALGVDRIIAGHVAKIGESYIVQIKLINIISQRPERRIYETVKGTEDILVSTIKQCVKKLVPKNEATTSGPASQSQAHGTTPPATVQSRATGEGGGIGALPLTLLGLGAATLSGGVYFGLKASGHEENADPAMPGSQRAAQDAKSADKAQPEHHVDLVALPKGFAVRFGGEF